MENFPRITLIEWKIFHVLAYYVRKMENQPLNFPLYVFGIYSIQQSFVQPTQFYAKIKQNHGWLARIPMQGSGCLSIRGVFEYY
jgi:hypothetical protein